MIRYEKFVAHTPDDTDIELRTFVIAIEFISQSGDHILWFSLLDLCNYSNVATARKHAIVLVPIWFWTMLFT